MSEHCKMDKAHPDYAEYKSQFDDLLKEHEDRVNAIMEKYRGQKGKVTERPIGQANRWFCKNLAELSKKYAHLYTIQLTEEEERKRRIH